MPSDRTPVTLDAMPEPGQPAFDRLVERIQRFRQAIPASVKIVAVTKYTAPWTMRAAYHAGIRDFGENRVQDAAQKQEILSDLSDVTWHLIGHLQSNKALKAIQIFDCIQSIDSMALAERLDRLLASSDPTIARTRSTCLQIKLLPDDTKSGWTLPDLQKSLPALQQLQHLNIQGIMVIPPIGLTIVELREYFQQALSVVSELEAFGLKLPIRSMGMSDDYAIAIEQGATLVRPGRILFQAPAEPYI